jgi:type III secretion protein U
MGEKTEKATPKKLQDARKKGQVAKSQDAPSFVTFAVSMSMTIALIPHLYEQISSFLITMFQASQQQHLTQIIPNGFHQAILLILTLSIPILIVVVFFGVITNFLLIGPVFSVEVFKPDIKKFDPIKNLKAKFKLKTFVELLKSLFKISGAFYLAYTVVDEMIPEISKSSTMEIEGALLLLHAFLKNIIIRVGLLFLVISAFDLVYQRRSFAKEMMMEKFEIKQEYKNTEGDPQIKSKRKEVAREIAYSEGPAAAVQHATVVIVNPTHVAVGIAYEMGIDPAPYILATGENYAAKLIIKEAKRYNVPILSNEPLARQLFEEGELWEFIPESAYEPVAEILKWLQSLKPEWETDNHEKNYRQSN